MYIITELLGGLGNQMFQYAAGRALAHRLQIPLKLDITKFKDYKFRSYKLNHFNIQEDFATLDDLQAFSIPEKGWPLLLFKMKNLVVPSHQKIIVEKKGGYNENFDRISGSCWLKGYWQSERYFKNIEKIIRKEFRVKEKVSQLNQELLIDIKKTNSVSLHIRRGDYVHDSTTNKYHGFLGLKYYEQAIRYITSNVEHPVFFIFSDDIPWARKNIKSDTPLIFIDHNGVEKDYEDMRLMTNCKHHIIANSSFSWWGAWLSDHQEQYVIAPKNWFTPQTMEKKGDIEIVPNRWVSL